MSRYTNVDIKKTLGELRSNLRAGNVAMSFRQIPGRPVVSAGTVLRTVVASAFGIDKDAFDTENFNPQTLKRFATLFVVPTRFVSSSSTVDVVTVYPSQDDVATALQNFINRRANPWPNITVKAAPGHSLLAIND